MSTKNSDDEFRGYNLPVKGSPLTGNPLPNVNDEWKSAAFESPADPRLVAFVTAFACWLADKDYDRLVNEGKQPWNDSEDADD